MKKLFSLLLLLIAISIFAATPQEIENARALYQKDMTNFIVHGMKLAGIQELTPKQKTALDEAMKRHSERFVAQKEKRGQLDAWIGMLKPQEIVAIENKILATKTKREFSAAVWELSQEIQGKLNQTVSPQDVEEMAKSFAQLRRELSPEFPEVKEEDKVFLHSWEEKVIDIARAREQYRNDFINRYLTASQLAGLRTPTAREMAVLEMASERFSIGTVEAFGLCMLQDTFLLMYRDATVCELHWKMLDAQTQTEYLAATNELANHLQKNFPELMNEKLMELMTGCGEKFATDTASLKNAPFMRSNTKFNFWNTVLFL